MTAPPLATAACAETFHQCVMTSVTASETSQQTPEQAGAEGVAGVQADHERNGHHHYRGGEHLGCGAGGQPAERARLDSHALSMGNPAVLPGRGSDSTAGSFGSSLPSRTALQRSGGVT